MEVESASEAGGPCDSGEDAAATKEVEVEDRPAPLAQTEEDDEEEEEATGPCDSGDASMEEEAEEPAAKQRQETTEDATSEAEGQHLLEDTTDSGENIRCMVRWLLY